MLSLIENLESRVCLSAVLMGDADLSGTITGNDYTLIDHGFAGHLSGWQNGDFNGDGAVNGSDYTLEDQAFNFAGSAQKTYAAIPGIDTVQQCATAAQPGDTIVILPGTFHESITLPRPGTPGHPISFVGLPFATIDANGFAYAFNGGNGYGGRSYINLSGLLFSRCANPLQYGAVVVGSNSNVTDCTVQNCDSAGLILQGANITLERVNASFNGEDGIDINSAGNVTADSCIVSNNNPGMLAPVWAGSQYSIQSGGLWYSTLENGGAEITRANNTTITNWQVFSNSGPGIHFDVDCRASLVSGCTFGAETRYPGEGTFDVSQIEYEISYGPATITGNTFNPNPGDGLTIATSSNVTVTANTFKSSLSMTNWNRGGTYNLANIAINHNSFYGVTTWYGGGNLYSWNSGTAAAHNLVADYDSFISPVPSNGFVNFGSNSLKTLSQMRAFGIEFHGLIG